jgi:hypothetical protein
MVKNSGVDCFGQAIAKCSLKSKYVFYFPICSIPVLPHSYQHLLLIVLTHVYWCLDRVLIHISWWLMMLGIFNVFLRHLYTYLPSDRKTHIKRFHIYVQNELCGNDHGNLGGCTCEWTHILWYIHKTEYYSTIKMNELKPLTIRMTPKDIIPCKTQALKKTYYKFDSMWNSNLAQITIMMESRLMAAWSWVLRQILIEGRHERLLAEVRVFYIFIWVVITQGWYLSKPTKLHS